MSRNKKDNGSSKSGFNIFKVVFFALLAVLLCVAGIMIRDYLIRKRAEDRFRDLQNQATVEAATEGSDPSASRAKVFAKSPKVRPSDTDDVSVKTIQVGAEPSQTTTIGGNLGEK